MSSLLQSPGDRAIRATDRSSSRGGAERKFRPTEAAPWGALPPGLDLLAWKVRTATTERGRAASASAKKPVITDVLRGVRVAKSGMYKRRCPAPVLMSGSSPIQDQATSAYAVGDLIAGKYALEELLGEGGMGAVFRARNTTIDMPVAIKLIRADLDRELLSGRLLQEARAAAKLGHPAIVRVFDVGKTALGDPFIVMELLQGESLAQVIERDGRISSARAVQLLLPIADALSVAHGKGFVHRDVKPDNVFIANDEEGQLQPKLVDFGIVKQERQIGDSQLTQVGAVLGSPDYMSPEQARGLDTIDQRSDVWSFSVVLYEAITGVTPFQSTNYNALLRMIVEAEPVSLHDQQAADHELSQIVQRGLSKDPNARFATMGQMGKALASWLCERGISEDACGVSLEARWLSRTSDPTSPGRMSRTSAPDSWPEPPSGVRSVSGSLGAGAGRLSLGASAAKLGNAPTVPHAKNAGTPFSLANTSTELPAHKRRLYLGLAGGAIGLALLLGWFGAAHSTGAEVENGAATALPPPATAALRPEQLAPVILAPAPTSVPAPPAAPEASASVRARPLEAGRSTRPVAPAAAAKGGPRAEPVAKPQPGTPAPPRSDLISPY
jgi:eukaryotic-like serine/threonine-protein kinase